MNDPLRPSRKPLNPLLRIALLTGVEAAVRVRIRRGDDLSAADDKGRSPLMLAASRGHVGICRLLLDAGADPAARDYEGNAALGLAIENGCTEVAGLLRERLAALVEPVLEGLKEPSSIYPLVIDIEDAVSGDAESESDEDGLDLSAWEPDPESPPPLADTDIPILAGALRYAISVHSPIDTDEDWSDIEIDLPDVHKDRRRRGVLDEERRAAARGLFLDGLRDGALPLWQIAEVARGGGVEPDHGFAAHFLLVAGDLGILIDDDPMELRTPGEAGNADQEVEQLAEDALGFLSDLASTNNDPASHYSRDVGAEALLSREDEVDLGRAMEEGRDAAVAAVADSAPAIAEVLRMAAEVRRREVLPDPGLSQVVPSRAGRGGPDVLRIRRRASRAGR